MSLKELRTKEVVEVKSAEDKITCDTAELKDFIEKWASSEAWKFENFADFLELTGVKTPVKLSKFDEEDCKFNCFTALGTEVKIRFVPAYRIGDGPLFISTIGIIDGNEERIYSLNRNVEIGKSVPKVELLSRIIEREGKSLDRIYFPDWLSLFLTIDDTHLLSAKIIAPNECKERSEFGLREYADMEEYFCKLDNSLVVSEVFDRIMEFLHFSSEDISNSREISISYSEIDGEERRVIDKVALSYGKVAPWL